MTSYSSGITAVLARMDTNPSEFFGDAPKWGFIFKERFREVLTEPEKGALHEKLKDIRRQEFDSTVMRTLLDDQMQGRWDETPKTMIVNQGQGHIAQNAVGSMYGNPVQNQSALQGALKNNSGGLLGFFK